MEDSLVHPAQATSDCAVTSVISGAPEHEDCNAVQEQVLSAQSDQSQNGASQRNALFGSEDHGQAIESSIVADVMDNGADDEIDGTATLPDLDDPSLLNTTGQRSRASAASDADAAQEHADCKAASSNMSPDAEELLEAKAAERSSTAGLASELDASLEQPDTGESKTPPVAQATRWRVQFLLRVREAASLTSSEIGTLRKSSIVEELQRDDMGNGKVRIRYKLIAGVGPPEGWISATDATGRQAFVEVDAIWMGPRWPSLHKRCCAYSRRTFMAALFLLRYLLISNSTSLSVVAAAILARFIFDDVTFTVLMVTIVCVFLAISFVRLQLRALRRPGVFMISPTAFCKRDFLTHRNLGTSTLDMWSSYVFLSSLLFALFLVRILPDILPYYDSKAVESLLLQSFPGDLRLQINNGTLQALQPSEPSLEVTTIIPRFVNEMCNNFQEVKVDSVGLPDLVVVLHLLRAGYAHIFGGFDPFVRTTQYAVGDEVDARLDGTLLACGASRRLLPPPLGGVWLRAAIKTVYPSPKLTDFTYTICLDGGENRSIAECMRFTEGNSSMQHNASDDRLNVSENLFEKPQRVSQRDFLTCKVQTDSLRREHRATFMPPENTPLLDRELQAKRALLIFEKSRFAVLEGYSYHHKQHWQWAGMGRISEAKAATLWHDYYQQLADHPYSVVALAANFFCTAVGSEDGLVCSRSTARERIQDSLEWVPFVASVFYTNMHLPLFIIGLWVAAVLSMIIVGTLEMLFVFLPIAYVASIMFRHVDTPVVPILRVLSMIMYSTLPLNYGRRLLTALWQIWGLDHHLPHFLEAVVMWDRNHTVTILMVWALWNSFLVIRMRAHISIREHARRTALHRRQRNTAKSRRAPSLKSDTVQAVSEGGKESDTSVKEPGVAADAANASANTSLAVQSSHVCRICYGGPEEGRLFSPCLCTGSMRFVHLECLNVWRMSSSNPTSFYQCDQCQYRYSFQRALYANVLRSAVVLHILTLIIFLLAVLGCSYLALILDRTFGSGEGGALKSIINEELLERLSNETNSGMDVDVLRDQLIRFSEMSWHGIQWAHLFGGLMMVGFSGFVSMGFFPFPWGARNRDHGGGPLLLILIVGTIRVLFAIYSMMRSASGKVLRSAEGMILDVGTGAVATSDPPPVETCPQQHNADTSASLGDGAAGGAASCPVAEDITAGSADVSAEDTAAGNVDVVAEVGCTSADALETPCEQKGTSGEVVACATTEVVADAGAEAACTATDALDMPCDAVDVAACATAGNTSISNIDGGAEVAGTSVDVPDMPCEAQDAGACVAALSVSADISEAGAAGTDISECTE